ncbi:MAG: hypothetical protein CVV44_03730 [Spirochaetae bacterium HGW-Spirochaetae-1]|jgi:sodium-dependent dicarboxylate transporter 2/3/5|nr:MAG: hypothetical protein CVV44_03730 [Spirochaetae bacterium HGW-Spirochaetae-1]
MSDRENNVSCETGESWWKKGNGLYFRLGFFILSVIVMAVILLLPEPTAIDTGTKLVGLGGKGKATLAVLSLAVILWITEALPFAITGLLAMSLLVVTKAAPFKQLVNDGFGNPIILFFLGVLILSAAIADTTIMRRIAAFVLYKLGHSPSLIILSFLIVGSFISGWVTDMAVAAMLMPIGVSILRDARLEPLKSNFGRSLMISCAWGPLIGGISTPAGCGPNPLTMGFLKDLAGVNFTFLQWMALGFPAMILMIPAAWVTLVKVFPLEKINLTISRDDYAKQKLEMGGLTKKEGAVLIILAITIFLWIMEPFINDWTGGVIDYLDISFVAVTCGLLFFIPGIETITWKKAESSISWGGIILIVSGLSMGMAIYKTGAAEWIAWISFHSIGGLHPALIIFIIVLGVSLMKVIFSSNTVTGIIVVPLLIALAKNLGLDPVLLAIPAGITSSLAFILVTSTPTNVIPHSSGYFTIGDMAKAGVFMTIFSSVSVTISVYFMSMFIGIIKF